MNKFKTMKYKTSTNGVGSNDHSIFDKLSKRYSTVRFLRKSDAKKVDPKANPVCGSYDMSGRDSEDHKLEIGAPILISKTTIDADTIDTSAYRNSLDVQRNSDQSDIYHDADSSLEMQQSAMSFGDLKFSFYTAHESDTSANETNTAQEKPQYAKIKPLPDSSIEINNNSNFVANRSKSATNLHKTELSLYLQRSPSMDITNKFSKSLSLSKNGSRTVSKHSVDSDGSYNNSRNSIAINGSSEFVTACNGGSTEFDEEVMDFDMKSASFQSLDARNIFLSIEELNDITRQINESDEFNAPDEHDLEYCSHRDNLRPCERRVTLLRNKNQKFLNIAPKRDKLTNAWSGFKSWIGEEKGKIREVVNKHAAMQRVGANTKAITASEGSGERATVVNGTALQITQSATESRTDSLDHVRGDSVDGTHERQHSQERRVIGAESNETQQNSASARGGRPLHELEVNVYKKKKLSLEWTHNSCVVNINRIHYPFIEKKSL